MDVDRLLRVLAFLAILAALIALGVWAVRYARKGSSGAAMLGAALLLMGFGTMRDPSNEVAVQQAKEPRKREDGDTGDPPAKD